MSFLLLLSVAYVSFIIIKRGYLFIEDIQGIFWKGMILLSGFFSVFTGIDRGESIYGFWRLCVYLIAGIAVQQIQKKNKCRILLSIPVLGIFLSICSLFQSCVIFKNWISLPTGRLAGPFEYPNTMALFLLIGVVITKHLWQFGKQIIQFLLIIGIFATGSRTVFVVLFIYLFYCFVKSKGDNKVFIMLILVASLIAYFTVIYGQNLYGLSRFIKININSSTLQGRLLYWEDALRMLIKHPFGLGYMGYFYLQQAEQTGVYSVRFVHNEWLQWILDYGILAGIGLIMYLVRQMQLKKMESIEKELLCVIGVCSFFDFHLQFISIVCILILLFPRGDSICSSKTLQVWRCITIMGVFIAIGLVIAGMMAQYLASHEDYEHALRWNPLSARYKQEYLLQSKDLKSAAIYADKLLQDNQYLYIAYLIKSNAAAQEGKIDVFITNRKQMLSLRKYKINEYEDYFQILLSWYLTAGAEQNIQVMNQCKAAMKEIPEMIRTVKKQTSVRAYYIQQKPKIYFNKEYERIIDKL